MSEPTELGQTVASLHEGPTITRWILALGRMTYHFGRLEWCSYKAIELFSRDDLIDWARNLQFKARTELAREVLRTRLKAAAHKDLLHRWENFFQESLEAAADRNGYAHNPLMLAVFMDDAGDVSYKQGIAPMKHPLRPLFSIEEVEASNSRLEGLAERMTELLQTTSRIDFSNGP